MNKERWMVSAKKADFYGLGSKLHLDPVVIRLIRNRGVFSEKDEKSLTDSGESVAERKIRSYIDGSLEELHDPSSMKDLIRGAEIIEDAIHTGKKIRIIGDYDIDGIMSTYLLLTAFRRLGGNADARIPDRIRDGYGLNENLVREAISDHVELLVTCDNGIAAASQIRLAKDAGLRTVVTDHHQIPFTDHDPEEPDFSELKKRKKLYPTADGRYREYIYPPADAVIDPHRPDETYPFDGLCGAGVAFKLICYLYDQRQDSSPEENRSDKEELLQYVGIATVGDIMDLQDENRILVREGLRRLHQTDNPGLQELILQNGLEPEQVDVYHIGFVLGPCLNASGRLETANVALKMLLSDSREEAAKLAGDLIALNASRKDMTAEGAEQAIEMVESTDLKNDRVLVVFLPECHESLAGIIAGRLKEHYNKPAFVLTRNAEGVKGSGRSIETYSMYEELCKCRDLLTKFGGHPMAAGLSMPEENVEPFRKKINELCTLTEQQMMPKVSLDMTMPVSYISKNLVQQMDLLKPFGKGNTKPLFAEKNLRVNYPRMFGKNRNVCKMQLTEPSGYTIDAIYFGDADEFVRYTHTHPSLTVAYYPGIDTWQGRNRLQLTITNYR